MATIKDVITLLFGAKGQKPKTLEEFDAAIAKAEAEIAAANAQAVEHTRLAEFLSSEAAIDGGDEYAARLEKEELAAKECYDRARKIGAALTGLRRRRAEILARQAEEQRGAYLESVRAKCRQVESFAARIDENRATEALLWSEMLTAAGQLHGLMPDAVAGREVAIIMPSLAAMRPPRDRPSARDAALNVCAAAMRSIGAADDAEAAA